MKKLIFVGIALLLTASIAVIAQKTTNPENEQIAQWEKMAEKGDTAAIHRLIEFYDENSPIYMEVEEVLEVDSYEWSYEWVNEYGDTIISYCDSVVAIDDVPKMSPEQTENYTRRLEYWLDKGITMNDPIALYTKGMRLYYEDETKAITYLTQAADAGSAQAALFCGSACLNQGKENEAFKYLSLAYQLGVPSAGWHLAMCYSAGIGTEPNKNKAVGVMRHAAIMNYPEAVSEMRRIEPDNPIWKHKADSLNISFPDFPIIP